MELDKALWLVMMDGDPKAERKLSFRQKGRGGGHLSTRGREKEERQGGGRKGRTCLLYSL